MVFFGSDDPATGLLITSSTNTLDDVIEGVTIDLLGASDDPVTITIATIAMVGNSRRIMRRIELLPHIYRRWALALRHKPGDDPT